MCYSAQIVADYRKFVRMFGALMDIHEFARLLFERTEGISKAKIPKAMEDAFAEPRDDSEAAIKQLIDRFNAEQTSKLEQDLFKQRKRLADAERTLQTKVTKAATESQRIANDKIVWTLHKLDDIQRMEPKPRDSRIFPGHFARVMVMENGRRVVSPCVINVALLVSRLRTTSNTPAHTRRAAIISRASGNHASATPTAYFSLTFSTKMS